MSFRIRDLAHLTELAARDGEGIDCFIVLAGGAARSSKNIRYIEPVPGRKTGQFDVFNEIDGSVQTLWPKQHR